MTDQGGQHSDPFESQSSTKPRPVSPCRKAGGGRHSVIQSKAQTPDPEQIQSRSNQKPRPQTPTRSNLDPIQSPDPRPRLAMSMTLSRLLSLAPALRWYSNAPPRRTSVGLWTWVQVWVGRRSHLFHTFTSLRTRTHAHPPAPLLALQSDTSTPRVTHRSFHTRSTPAPSSCGARRSSEAPLPGPHLHTCSTPAPSSCGARRSSEAPLPGPGCCRGDASRTGTGKTTRRGGI